LGGLTSESGLSRHRCRDRGPIATAEKGRGCVKSRTDAMILQVNRQAGATDVRLRGGDRSEPEQFVSSPA